MNREGAASRRTAKAGGGSWHLLEDVISPAITDADVDAEPAAVRCASNTLRDVLRKPMNAANKAPSTNGGPCLQFRSHCRHGSEAPQSPTRKPTLLTSPRAERTSAREACCEPYLRRTTRGECRDLNREQPLPRRRTRLLANVQTLVVAPKERRSPGTHLERRWFLAPRAVVPRAAA